MREPTRAYRLLMGVSERSLQDLGKIQTWMVQGYHFLLRKADPDRMAYDLAVAEQRDDLVELELLKSSIQVKQAAVLQGGFAEEHGPALEVVANGLYELCMWEDEEITEWFAALVLDDDGENLGAEFTIDEEEE